MDNIYGNSDADLIEKLREINIAVPRRTEGRTTEDVERSSIVRLLLTYTNENRLEYPLSLVHSDAPDFHLQSGQHSIGIECTESIPEQLAWAQSIFEQEFPDGFFEPEFFRWGSPKRTREDIIEILTKSQNKLHGAGWIGNSVERDWSKWMSECVVAKTEKLNTSKFEAFDQNHLLVYDNLPQASIDLNLATKLLLDELNILWRNDVLHFNRILIETGDELLDITPLTVEQYSIPKYPID